MKILCNMGISIFLLMSVITYHSFADTTPKADPYELLGKQSAISLTDSLIKNFIGTAKELNRQEKTIDFEQERSPLEDMRLGREGMDIIVKHGFDIIQFQQVAYSIGMAFGAEAMQGKSAEIEQARQQLQTMKGRLPEAQYEMLKQQMMNVFQVFADQPSGNIELVAKYRDQLQALGE
ncbi:MAG: hypothetical protein ACI92E_000201 [Oceanicoccus sp.]|jgi:hypothetical protein